MRVGMYCTECGDPILVAEGEELRKNKKYCALCLLSHKQECDRKYQRRKREANRLNRSSK